MNGGVPLILCCDMLFVVRCMEMIKVNKKGVYNMASEDF